MATEALQPSRFSAADAEADRHCLENLLNCYCREVAVPDGRLSFGSRFGQNDWPLALRAAQQEGPVMHLLLPRSHVRVIGVVERPTASGCYRYRGPFYGRAPGRGWSPLDWQALARLLLQELALRFDTPFNEELYAQIADSVETVVTILTHRQAPEAAADYLSQYIASEQALVFGHAFHPTPKSREGFSEEDRRRYSPELQVRFPLHYFAVQEAYVRQAGLLSDTPADLIRAQAPQGLAREGLALLPVHPWQARYLVQLPAVQQALRAGRLQDLGPQGEAYAATSSIRTLFHPHNPFFYKVSLQVRITNCVRKNAVYELEGALEVSRLLRDLQPDLAARFPDLRLLSEPGFMTVDLADAEPGQRVAVEEGFGLILREGLGGLTAGQVTPVLAGSLFAARGAGLPRARTLCAGIARRQGLPLTEVAEAWLAAYARRLLHPVFYSLFAHGVVFEPHLQNVLVGLREGWPVRVAIRDFEGVKLVRGRFPAERVAHLTPRAQEALWYDRRRGWNRVAYCLFVNQMCEVVAQLSGADAGLETRLWTVVRQALAQYQLDHGCAASRQAVRELLSGAALPAKRNFLNRVHKRADRAADYAPFPSPLAREGTA
jgi:siderophore synthetase component